MFNTSNHSRCQSNHSQRVPSSQRSRSDRSASSIRHSESKATWKIPVWVHCEKCYNNHDMNPKMSLLSCGHIFCRTCLRVDNPLQHEPVSCLRCKTVVTHIPLDASLDEKLHGMFQQSWMDPVLKIDLKHMQFMMTKSQNYSKYLAKSIKQNVNLSTEWMRRYGGAKKAIEHIQQLQKLQNELAIKTESKKSQCLKKYKNVQNLRSLYQRKKANGQRPEPQHREGQSNHPRKDMRFVSSGRNEQSNQYIRQLKSPHLPTNQSDGNIRNSSQRVTPDAQRQNVRVSQFREDTSKHSSDSVSRRPLMQSATFRPQTKVFRGDSHRFDPRGHAQKRLVPSYGYDEYKNPPKRAAQYPVRREIILDTSISSVGSSQVPNYNLMTKYNNRPKNNMHVSLKTKYCLREPNLAEIYDDIDSLNPFMVYVRLLWIVRFDSSHLHIAIKVFRDTDETTAKKKFIEIDYTINLQ